MLCDLNIEEKLHTIEQIYGAFSIIMVAVGSN